MTNAEIIKAKSNEELAEYISQIVDCDICKLPCDYKKQCSGTWLEWLNKEATP